MENNIKITNAMIDAVYKDIADKNNMSNNQIYNYITGNSNINGQTREEYIFHYYNNIVLKDNKNDINNADNSIDDVDKVNFEELTETDKQIIKSRKYMCHEHVKDLIQSINKLINVELSNNRRAVDEIAVIMHVVQAITRDAINAISDAQKILELIKQKRP